MADMVNHPAHYVGKIEVIDYLEDKLTSEQFEGYLVGNVLKYLSRYRKKNGLEDLKKGQFPGQVIMNKYTEIKINNIKDKIKKSLENSKRITF